MSKKILIIDDDRELAELFGGFLQTFGYPPPCYAGDGREGLFRLERDESISLVITDLEMPNLNGQEFINACRNLYPDKKIILMSGEFFPDDDLIATAKRYSADAVLPKPFLPHKVLDALTIAGVSPKMF